MHWRKRCGRRPAMNIPGHAHELTFTCYRSYPFLQAERTCVIHLNPVRRGLVQRPEDWKWSSAGWIPGKNLLRPDPVDFGGHCLFTGGRE